jgi:hypothetical protein
MSFFKKIKNIFSAGNTNIQTNNRKYEESFSFDTPDNVESFFKTGKEVLALSCSEDKKKKYFREILDKCSERLKAEICKTIRKDLYTTEYVDELDSDITTNLISLRFSLLNPIYKNRKNKKLARLFMIFFSIAPELMKGKKNADKTNLLSFSGDEDVDEIMSDLSFFNLSEKEIKYTASKIVEFNRKNVSYTNEEIIFLNNSETLRLALEKLSGILQDFIQQSLIWEKYFRADSVGLRKYKQNILNIDKKVIFKDKFVSSFFDLIMEKNINEELKPLVPNELYGVFEKDFNLIIAHVRNTIVKEHKKLIFDFEKVLAWGIVLLKELDELPPHNVLNSLIAKSLKFHENYYPDLIRAVNPIREKLLSMLKEDYSGMNAFLFCYGRHIAEGISHYSLSKYRNTLEFGNFLEKVNSMLEKTSYAKQEHVVVEYYPEELNLLKRSPDAELSIIMLNEKVAKSEKGVPIVDGEYFYASKSDYLKVVLFETLLNMMNDDVSLKVLKSLLLKSLDKTKGESSEIMAMLLQRLREEGFKKDLIIKLHKKQLKKNHVTSRIKQKIAENTTWEWLVASEDPEVLLDKFSKVTGLTFFTLKGSKGEFKVTATFKGDDWYINRIAPVQPK